MTEINTVHTVKEYPINCSYKICWSAIFAGAFIGLGLGFLLHLYSGAISLSAYSSSQSGASVIAIGGFLGLLIGTIVSMIAAGFVSGYLGRYHYCHISGGIIYGFITWSLALIMSVLLAGAMMQYISMYTYGLQNPVVQNTPKVEITNQDTDSNVPVPTHQNTTKENAKKVTPTDLAWSGWIVFILFFIGALSSCIGAIWGMHCKREEHEHHIHDVNVTPL